MCYPKLQKYKSFIFEDVMNHFGNKRTCKLIKYLQGSLVHLRKRMWKSAYFFSLITLILGRTFRLELLIKMQSLCQCGYLLVWILTWWNGTMWIKAISKKNQRKLNQGKGDLDQERERVDVMPVEVDIFKKKMVRNQGGNFSLKGSLAVRKW